MRFTCLDTKNMVLFILYMGSYLVSTGYSLDLVASGSQS